ncbi:MAG: peptidylprolyl isomerase [Prevotellaceae bacterium]|jgi:peptidyl-prolyl cis-trans isomerase B (cyclophilin B)|nr:peptidylprolyl isomerase [Prevotellaceae bacterium]
MKTKLILLALSAACLVASCGGSSSKKATENADANKKEEQVVEKAAVKERTPIPENLSEEPIIELQTSKGNIKIKLYKDTPLHRDNFIKLVSEGYYNGVLFHRVIKEFMIQTGDPESINAAAGQRLGMGGPDYKISAEILPNHYHKKGALAAARTENPLKESSGSQFYIVQGRPYSDEELNGIEARSGIKFTQEQRAVYKSTGGAPHLDGGYTVFGEVIEGLGVVDAVAGVEVDGNNRPLADINVIKATILE